VFLVLLYLWETVNSKSWKLYCLHNSPPCNYTLLPATVKLLKAFLEAILWKPFQLSLRILDDVSSTTIAPYLQYWFQSSERAKLSWIQVRRVEVYSIVVTLYYAKRSFTKTSRCVRALSWRRNQLSVFHLSGRFLLTASLRRRKMSMNIYSE
jgi:hypothetical protein